MESYKHFKVSFDSPKHRDTIDMSREIDEDHGDKERDSCFGAGALQDIEFLQMKKDESSQNRRKEVIQDLRNEWIQLIDSKFDIFPLIFSILKQKKIRDTLYTQNVLIGNAQIPVRSLKDKYIPFLQAFFPAHLQSSWFSRENFLKLPDEIIIECTKAYYNQTFLKMENFRTKVFPELIPRIKENLRLAIKEQGLSITEEYFEFVFTNTKVEPIDPAKGTLDEVDGKYVQSTDTIFVSTQRRIEHIEKTLTHEFFHALSGKTIIHYKDKLFHDEPPSETDRIGTYFRSGTKRTFFWMNEAITELLTMKTTNTKSENASYPEERKLLEFFLQKIDFSFFTKAYFEHFDPKLPPQERIPHWRVLAEKIKEVYGKYFLNDLEKYIELLKRQEPKLKRDSFALKKVVEDFTLHGDDFPNFLRKQIHPQ